MQTTGDGVAAAAELAAGVQDREHDLDGRLGGVGGVRVDRDAAATIDHADAAVGEDRHIDQIVVARERLVDGVVDDLVHEVMEAPLTGRADVHAGALAHGLEAFEHLDGICPVLVLDSLRLRGLRRGDVLGNAVGGIGCHRFRALLAWRMIEAPPDRRHSILSGSRSVSPAERPCGATKEVRRSTDLPHP